MCCFHMYAQLKVEMSEKPAPAPDSASICSCECDQNQTELRLVFCWVEDMIKLIRFKVTYIRVIKPSWES